MLTVGIPVYNEDRYIEEAVLSVVRQADKIIISDNCSTDETEGVCRKLANAFPNIHYVRQPKNIGPIANFKFCLDEADSDYFMWLGSHDRVSPTYSSSLISILEMNHDAVMAFAPTEHISDLGEYVGTYDYSYSDELLHDDPFHRVLTIIKKLSEATMIHGIFRTRILKESWIEFAGFGPDVALLTRAVAKGKFIKVESERYIRRNARSETYADVIVRRERDLLNNDELIRLQPFYNLIVEQLNVIQSISSDKEIVSGWLKLASDCLERKYGPFSSAAFYKEYWLQSILFRNQGITRLLNKSNYNQIFIFGTGKLACYLYKDMELEGMRPKAFLDNHEDKQNKTLYGIPIKSVESLRDSNDVSNLVLLSIEGNHDLSVIYNLRQQLDRISILSWKDIIRSCLRGKENAEPVQYDIQNHKQKIVFLYDRFAISNLVNQQYSNKKKCIFGTGKYGEQVYKAMREYGLKIDCFSDNNPAKWNKQIEGIKVIAPANLTKHHLIFIASSWKFEISEQLREKGFKWGEDFVWVNR